MRPLVLILLFALLVISQINTIIDSDIWCHFKTGEYIVKNLNVPQVDLFSYTLENRAWIDHEWLSQVLFYVIFAKFSWLGINMLKAIVISSCFFILLFFIISKYKKFIYAILFILLSVLAFGYRSFARPEIFSYLLLCLFFYMLEDERKIRMLPLLQVLWVNLHGYFILGPVLIFLYSLGELISGSKIKAKRLGAVFVLTCLACFINPYFYKGAFYPIKILAGVFTGDRLYMQSIQELTMPVNAGFGKYVFFWILAILSSVTFLANLKKAKMQHILIFLGAFMASYAAIRNMPVFIFMAMPLAVINLNESKLTKDITERNHYVACIFIILAAVYFFASNRYYVFTKQSAFRNTGSKMTEVLTPSKACDFLEKNNIKGRVFNSIDFGHYIAYRFYPEKTAFIDARTELYKDNFYKSYQRAQNYPGEWESLQRKYNFDVVLLRHIFSGTERILKYLYNKKEWALVYYDENSAIFLRDTQSNENAIEKFRINFSKKKIEKSDETLSIAGFFEKIGEQKLAEEDYLKLLELKPEFLEVGNNLAVIYINTGRFKEALEIIDKFLKWYPESAELYCNKGTVYLRMAKKEEGLAMLEIAAKLNPYLRQASYMLGLVYFEKGNTEKAMKQFVKYLTLDPYNAAGHRILGDIYKQKGLLKKAAAEYNEADALEGNI
jgi:Putative Zn-dependent protease, contains TPR repeats